MFLSSIKSTIKTASFGGNSIQTLDEFASIRAMQRDLYLMDDDGKLTGSGRRAVVLENDPDNVLYVGTNYEVTQNEELVPIIANIQKRTGYDVHKISSYSNKKFSVQLCGTEADLKIGHEKAYPTIIVNNSYDGSSKVSFNYGVVIQVCSNGATVTKGLTGLIQKHTSKIDMNYEKLLNDYEKLSRALANFNENSFDAGEDVALTNFKRLTAIFPETSKKDPHPLTIALGQRSEDEIKNNGYPANFGLFMAATNMTSFPERYGMATSYVPLLERSITDVFFG
jgi:hypothetical protein